MMTDVQKVEALQNIIKCKDDIIEAQTVLIGQLKEHLNGLYGSIDKLSDITFP